MPTIKFPLLLLRWQPITPCGKFITHLSDYIFNNSISGVPHLSTKDDVYEGYHIPSGSIVIFNAWYERHSCVKDAS